MIGRQPTTADALRDEAFQTLLKQLERLCPYEHAEHLLQDMGVALLLPENPGREALTVLGCAPPDPADDLADSA
jgi:hypothetical protein